MNRLAATHHKLADPVLGRYYKLLAQLCRDPDLLRATDQAAMATAITAPLNGGTGPSSSSSSSSVARAYSTFVASFLGEPDLLFWDAHVADFSPLISISSLAEATANATQLGREACLTILARFINLSRVGARSVAERAAVVEALYRQISSHSSDIKRLVDTKTPESEGPGAEPAPRPLSPFVKQALLSLCDKEAMADLLRDLSR